MYIFMRDNYFNIESEHLRIDFNIGILNIVILVFIDIINVILNTIINL